MRPHDGRKGADVLLHQVYFAAEGDTACRADALLLIEPGREGAAPAQEDIEPLDQGVPTYPRVSRAGSRRVRT